MAARSMVSSSSFMIFLALASAGSISGSSDGLPVALVLPFLSAGAAVFLAGSGFFAVFAVTGAVFAGAAGVPFTGTGVFPFTGVGTVFAATFFTGSLFLA